MEFIDKTDEPVSAEEIKEMLKALNAVMIGGILNVPPQLAVHFITLRKALHELLVFKIKPREEVKE